MKWASDMTDVNYFYQVAGRLRPSVKTSEHYHCLFLHQTTNRINVIDIRTMDDLTESCQTQNLKRY